MFIDVFNDVTMIPKLGRAVEGPYGMLKQDQHTGVIQRKELFQRSTADDKVALSPWPTGMPAIPPELPSTMDIQDRILRGAPWLFYRILDQYLNDDVQHEFLLNWAPDYEATWEPRIHVPGEAIFKCSARMRKAMPDRCE